MILFIYYCNLQLCGNVSICYDCNYYSSNTSYFVHIFVLREINFGILSNWKVFDRKDGFPFDYELNITFKQNMIVVTVFLLIINQMGFCLVHN